MVLLFLDAYRKNNNKQKLNLLQFEKEKEILEKENKLKELQFQLELEVKQTKERELIALQLKTFQIKEKIITFLNFNDLNFNKQIKETIFNAVVGCFENDDYWKEFLLRFTSIHPNFIVTVKKEYLELTKKDLDFLILIKLNLSNKEIATLISISYESVISKRYLLRKKMGFSTDNELQSYLFNK